MESLSERMRMRMKENEEEGEVERHYSNIINWVKCQEILLEENAKAQHAVTCIRKHVTV